MKPEVMIDGTAIQINGRPSCEGRSHRGQPIDGLLFNFRMDQAIFDDECPETRTLWKYPDTGTWGPDRKRRFFGRLKEITGGR